MQSAKFRVCDANLYNKTDDFIVGVPIERPFDFVLFHGQLTPPLRYGNKYVDKL